MSNVFKNKYLLIFGSPILFALDMAIFFVTENKGFFDNNNAWRLGLLCAPLAILSFIAAVIGIRKTQKLFLIVPIIELVLSLMLIYLVYYQFEIAENPGLWGV